MTGLKESNTTAPEPGRLLLRGHPVVTTAVVGAIIAAVVNSTLRTETPDVPAMAVLVVGAYLGPLGGLFGRIVGARIRPTNQASATDVLSCAVATTAAATAGLLLGAEYGTNMGENPAIFSATTGLLIGLSLGLLIGYLIPVVGRLFVGHRP